MYNEYCCKQKDTALTLTHPFNEWQTTSKINVSLEFNLKFVLRFMLFPNYQYMYYQDSVISSMPNLLQPLPPEENTKLIFRDKTTGNNIPKSYIPAIERVRLSRKKTKLLNRFASFSMNTHLYILISS